jgi:acetolactate synthase-1/2/3 large subunit
VAGLTRRKTRWRVADILVDHLVRSGINVVFGVPGGAIAAVNDAIFGRTEIRAVTTRTESGAVFAAAAYARATNKVGVVTVTSGPGAINTLTGVASARLDGLPVLVLAGEVSRHLMGKGALQEGSAHQLNVVGMARHICKFACELSDPNAALATLQQALKVATTGKKGPVFISIPLDVSTAVTERPGIVYEERTVSIMAPGMIAKVAATLIDSPRPLIFAGSGCRWGDGPALLLSLAERLQAPVMTTPKAKGVFPESHPLSLGVFGHGGHPSAFDFLANPADVLLAIGTSLADPATNSWSKQLVPNTHFVYVNIDPAPLGRNYPVSVGIAGSAEAFLADLLKALGPGALPQKKFGIRRCTQAELEALGPEGRITPQRALWELQQWLGPEAIYTCDIGEHLMFATHYLSIDRPDGFMVMTGLAPVGTGIPAAIGLKLAHPDRPVAAVVGDCCFCVSAPELAAAAQAEIPIIVAVLNNGRLSMVELGNMANFGRTPRYPCDALTVADAARGLGAQSWVAEQPDQIAAAEIRACKSGRLTVIDVRIDRKVTMPQSSRFEELAQSMKSGSQPCNN